MALFLLTNDGLSSIEEKPFKLEKDIQTLCERNLNVIMNLEFVTSEFSIGNFRIDTLAYDKESCSFVIIEYKRQKKLSIDF